MKQKFNVITSSCVPLQLENVDTDQIIPARFLKATTREESFFGDNLFRDWRYNADGTPNKDFVLNNNSLGSVISPVIRFFQRTCCMGYRRLWFQGGHQQFLCRYPQEQRTE